LYPGTEINYDYYSKAEFGTPEKEIEKFASYAPDISFQPDTFFQSDLESGDQTNFEWSSFDKNNRPTHGRTVIMGGKNAKKEIKKVADDFAKITINTIKSLQKTVSKIK
jgi:hypothetical protein